MVFFCLRRRSTPASASLLESLCFPAFLSVIRLILHGLESGGRIFHTELSVLDEIWEVLFIKKEMVTVVIGVMNRVMDHFRLPHQKKVISNFQLKPNLLLKELLTIQQQGPRSIGFFGTRNMGFMHQQLIEILSYAMVITKNHIFTSGASGTNAAVIRGALRAEKPELLTVILPQSLKMQPPESQDLLSKVKNLIEMPKNDHLPLIEASRLCNMDILSKVQQVICFAFHDSRLLLETCQEARKLRKLVTLFYLD
ncbi:uncharacterized protein LOC141835143 isoform X2 [Curcuma longa]|uniref:uncharacterized protein LOC141835143 isoform X2 n=1 Tax=Curcuma longa TaxID=136217 RepID=UPI003D9E35FF